MPSTVKIARVAKTISDASMTAKLGHSLGPTSFKLIVTADTDCFYTDDKGTERILFKFRKDAIPPAMRQVALTSFEGLARKGRSLNRGYAAGLIPGLDRTRSDTRNHEARKAKSNIAGFMDRNTLSMKVRRLFPGRWIVCRTTAFTRDHPELWRQGIPFLKTISDLYKELAPEQHTAQQLACRAVPKSMLIPGTVFSTMTCNLNFRTAVHTDKGDFGPGLGNLTVVGNEAWSGCLVGFPQFGVAINVRPGDFLLMDTSVPHCNTPLKVGAGGVRLSFVCYLRNDMTACSHRKVVDGEVYYIEK